MNDTGRSMTETLGGFWQGVNEDPVFVPMDEFIAQKFIETMESDALSTDLVLENEGG